MAKFQDLVGQQFGDFMVIKRAESRRNNYGKLVTYWECRCKCGIVFEIRKDGLNKKRKCIHSKKHINPRLYIIHRHMIERCCNPNHKYYHSYGGRGIKICDEWLDKENGCYNFSEWALKNGYNPFAKFHECTLDRIDVNGNYEPNNCRFVSNYIQARNKRNNIYITYKNKTQIMADWARECGIPANLFRFRYLKGWDIDRIKNTPIRKRGAEQIERRNFK